MSSFVSTPVVGLSGKTLFTIQEASQGSLRLIPSLDLVGFAPIYTFYSFEALAGELGNWRDCGGNVSIGS